MIDITCVVNQFLFDPADAQHIFLATTMGVFETKNGGEQWTKKMEGMKEVLMVVTLGMDPTRPSILYAGTSGGVYKSMDQAGHWVKVNNGLVPLDMVKTSRALNVTSVLVDPYEPDTVYAATLAGLYKTTDAAKGWKRIGESLADQMIYHGARPDARRDPITDGWRHQVEMVGRCSARVGTPTSTIAQSEADPGFWHKCGGLLPKMEGNWENMMVEENVGGYRLVKSVSNNTSPVGTENSRFVRFDFQAIAGHGYLAYPFQADGGADREHPPSGAMIRHITRKPRRRITEVGSTCFPTLPIRERSVVSSMSIPVGAAEAVSLIELFLIASSWIIVL